MRHRNDAAALELIDRAIEAWVLDERIRRLSQLAAENRIDLETKSGPLQLALFLAQKHEPGFQVDGFEKSVGKVGRPKGKSIDGLTLQLAVLELMQEKRLASAVDALKMLHAQRKGPWSEFTISALKTAYSRASRWPSILADDPFVAFVEKRIALHRNVPQARSSRKTLLG